MACCMSSTGSFRITGSSGTDIASSINSQTSAYNNQMNLIQQKLSTIETKMCLWAAPTYGDTGENAEKTFWKAALIAVATLNSAAQLEIANKRYQIAKDYADISKDKWERFVNAYAPLERAMINEIMNTLIPEPDYERARNDGNSHTRNAYLWAQEHMSDLAKQYRLCFDTTFVDDMSLAESIAADDGVNFNYRDEEYNALIEDDLRWNRRSALGNLGRDLQAQSVSYASAANNSLAALSAIIGEGAQGAAGLLGYLSEYRNTQYPTQFSAATPLYGESSSIGSSIAIGPIAGS